MFVSLFVLTLTVYSYILRLICLNPQEVGMQTRAKACLQYVVFANMLSGGGHDPFDAREANVYQNDADIAVFGKLRGAFDRSDVK